VNEMAFDVDQTQLEHREQADGTSADDHGIGLDRLRWAVLHAHDQNCFSGTVTMRPSSSGVTLIWQDKRLSSRTSKAKSSMSSSISPGLPTFSRHAVST